MGRRPRPAKQSPAPRKPPPAGDPEAFVRAAGAAPAAAPRSHAPPGRAAPRRGLIVRGQGTAQERALKRVAAYFPAALGTELAVYAARTGVTLSDVIVEAVRRFLAAAGP